MASSKIPKKSTGHSESIAPRREIFDISIERRLRRDLKLTSADIAVIDLDLAVEAGLVEKPERYMRTIEARGPSQDAAALWICQDLM